MALDKLKIDDPVGAISVHGVVGIWGLIAVCFTNPDAFVWQLIGIVIDLRLGVPYEPSPSWFAIKSHRRHPRLARKRSTRAWTSPNAASRPIPEFTSAE